MLQNIRDLFGHQLAATDGKIGHIKDFYFSDRSWAVRYLVADTGNWLGHRLILLSPHVFGPTDRTTNLLPVHLTRSRIEQSPERDSRRPVSRQFEHEYYDYYGWPAYWVGDGMWGVAPIPVASAVVPEIRPLHHGPGRSDDPHLRSMRAVIGYEVQGQDGALGYVRSFLVDEKAWLVGELLVETGHWYSANEVLISVHKVERISHEEAKVFVNVFKGDFDRT